MSDISRKIREARKSSGLSQAELARAIGVSQGTISKWESGAQQPEYDAAVSLARWARAEVKDFVWPDSEHPFITSDLGVFVNVVGAVESGKWLEKIHWEDEDHFQVQLPTRDYDEEKKLEGYLVKDEFIENLYPANSIVFCRPESDPDNIGNLDRVLVVRERKNGLVELTIRELLKYKETIISLRSNSRNPDSSRSFDLKPLRLTGDIVSIRIIGVVTASFVLEPKRSPNPVQGIGSNEGAFVSE